MFYTTQKQRSSVRNLITFGELLKTYRRPTDPKLIVELFRYIHYTGYPKETCLMGLWETY